MPFPLSVCILTLNEENNLPECLSSLKDLPGEVIILDSGSTDRTPEIAKAAGAKFHVHPFDNFGSQHKRLFSLAQNEWILNIDADERLSPELTQAIRDLFQHTERLSKFDGFSFNRLNFFVGKPIYHSGWAPDILLRLFRRSSGEMDQRMVHNTINVKGKTGHLDGLLIHYTYRTLESYLEKSGRYAKLSALDLRAKGRKPSFARLLFHPFGMAIKMYILRRGFLDGKEGLFLALLYSYYTFLKYLYLFYLSDPAK